MEAQDYLKGLQVKAGSATDFQYIVGGLTAALILIILVIIIRRYYIRYKAERQDYTRFRLICRKRRLSPEQINFLEEVIQKHRLRRRIVLVRNIQIFDKYMAWEIARFKNAETKHKEWMKSFVFELRKKLGFSDFENLEELTSTRQVQAGLRTKVTIEIAGMEKIFEGIIFKVDEEEVVVTVPEQFMTEEPIRTHQKATFTVTHTDDAEYDFKTIVYRIIQGPPCFVSFEHSPVYTRTQKRKYPRLNVEIPFNYLLLDRFQQKEFNERRTVSVKPDMPLMQGTILNISGGGCYFHSPVEYSVGNLIWLSLYLDDAGSELKDIVGHVERVTDLDNGDSRIILHFAKISDANRDRIARFVFHKKTEQKELAKELKKAKIG